MVFVRLLVMCVEFQRGSGESPLLCICALHASVSWRIIKHEAVQSHQNGANFPLNIRNCGAPIRNEVSANEIVLHQTYHGIPRFWMKIRHRQAQSSVCLKNR